MKEHIVRTTDDDAWLRRIVELCVVRGDGQVPDQDTLNELLRPMVRAGRDDLIEAAWHLLGSSPSALAVRERAEALAECVELSTGRHCRVFAAPVVMHFDEPVPESLVDDLIDRLAASLRLPKVPGFGQELMLPGFFTLLDLKDRTMAEVQCGATALALATSPNAANCALNLRTTQGSGKRASCFLRYAVGRVIAEDSEAPRQASRWPEVERDLTRCLTDRFDMTVRVESCFDGRFFHSVYQGMWEYQNRRLSQVAQSAREAGWSSTAYVEGGRLPQARRWFVGIGRQAGRHSHAYLLHSRPGDSFHSSYNRIEAGLRAGGVSAIYEPEPSGGNAPHRGFAVPL